MTSMARLFLIAYSLCALTAVFQQSQTQPAPVLPFSLTLSALTPRVEPGSLVAVKIVMKNLSNHDLEYGVGYCNGLDRNYDYDVRDSTGKRLEFSAAKHPELFTCHGWPPHIVKPGETDTSGGAVSNFYDLSKPGEYVIQVSRKISDRPKDGIVESNKVTISVVMPLAPKTQPPPPQK